MRKELTMFQKKARLFAKLREKWWTIIGLQRHKMWENSAKAPMNSLGFETAASAT
jgi:hypothetical protein